MSVRTVWFHMSEVHVCTVECVKVTAFGTVSLMDATAGPLGEMDVEP